MVGEKCRKTEIKFTFFNCLNLQQTPIDKREFSILFPLVFIFEVVTKPSDQSNPLFVYRLPRYCF